MAASVREIPHSPAPPRAPLQIADDGLVRDLSCYGYSAMYLLSAYLGKPVLKMPGKQEIGMRAASFLYGRLFWEQAKKEIIDVKETLEDQQIDVVERAKDYSQVFWEKQCQMLKKLGAKMGYELDPTPFCSPEESSYDPRNASTLPYEGDSKDIVYRDWKDLLKMAYADRDSVMGWLLLTRCQDDCDHQIALLNNGSLYDSQFKKDVQLWGPDGQVNERALDKYLSERYEYGGSVRSCLAVVVSSESQSPKQLGLKEFQNCLWISDNRLPKQYYLSEVQLYNQIDLENHLVSRQYKKAASAKPKKYVDLFNKYQVKAEQGRKSLLPAERTEFVDISDMPPLETDAEFAGPEETDFKSYVSPEKPKPTKPKPRGNSLASVWGVRRRARAPAATRRPEKKPKQTVLSVARAAADLLFEGDKMGSGAVAVGSEEHKKKVQELSLPLVPHDVANQMLFTGAYLQGLLGSKRKR